MKRLLLIFSLVIPAWLYSCSTKAPVPTPAEVIQQEHAAIPKAPGAQLPLPEPPFVITPTDPNQEKPIVRRKDHPAKRAVRPVPRHRPNPVAPHQDGLPPQQGPICLFPLNMIPDCRPQVAR